MDRMLLEMGGFFGTIAGFIYGVMMTADGFLAHVQHGVVFGIVGAYAGALIAIFQSV
jgi:hypothetical protein